MTPRNPRKCVEVEKVENCEGPFPRRMEWDELEKVESRESPSPRRTEWDEVEKVEGCGRPLPLRYWVAFPKARGLARSVERHKTYMAQIIGSDQPS